MVNAVVRGTGPWIVVGFPAIEGQPALHADDGIVLDLHLGPEKEPRLGHLTRGSDQFNDKLIKNYFGWADGA